MEQFHSYPLPQKNPFEIQRREVPLTECQFSYARAGGSGGQKVNKTSSKVLLRWSVRESRSFSDEEKQRIRSAIGVNAADEVCMDCDQERSQHQNKRIVKARLDSAVTAALQPVVERKPTAPTRGSQERRLAEKTRHGHMKKERRTQGQD